MADLKRCRELLSHIFPEGQYSETVAYTLREFVSRKERKLTATAHAQSVNRRDVLAKADFACEFSDPITGRVCGNRVRVERDHVIPQALGGDDSWANARALCRKHNQFMSEKYFGKWKSQKETGPKSK
jgi:5-methylcytosine-specific restriction endonuclease McrA